MRRLTWTLVGALCLVAGCEEATAPASTAAPSTTTAPAPEGEFLRRLTRAELERSLSQILGPIALTPTEPDVFSAGFARVGARHITVSNSGVERLSTAIEDAMDQIFADARWRDEVIGCDLAQGGCLDDMIRRVGQGAWRRPLDADEVTRYRALYRACDTAPHMGARCVLSGILQSPWFQYRVELPAADGIFRGYAMASRLSFLLWSLPPDLAVLQAAHAGQLETPQGVRQIAQQMLDDPRARGGLRAFVDEWYRTDRLGRLERDVLAQTDEELQFELGRTGALQPWLAWVAFAVEEELRALVEDHVFDQDADYLDLLTTDRTFVDDNLRVLYNITESEAGADQLMVDGPPNALGFAPARHAANSPRRGLLGTMALLGQLGKQNETSPTRRGLYVMRKVLCQEVAEPPDNIDMCARPNGVSRRDSMESHHMCAPTCAGCHAQMDPIGFALDRFNTIGRFRDVDDWGFPLDTAVEWRASNGDMLQFDSLRGMAQVFKERPEATECITRQVFRFATGREESLADAGQIEALTTALRDDGRRLKPFLVHFVGTDAFRRAPQHAEALPIDQARIVAEIFEPHCGVCHIATALGGVNLRPDDGLADRLRMGGSAGLPLIAPGDPAGSYLWLKVLGTHADAGGGGEQMPPSTPLSAAERALVKTWIEEGAR